MGVIKRFNSIGQPFGKVFPVPIVADFDPSDKDKKKLGQLWINQITPMAWFLVAYTNGLPVWIPISGAPSDVQFLRGNDGLLAEPLAGVINVHGDVVNFSVTRSPDINSLLISPGTNGSPITRLRTQDGNDVTPTLGRIIVNGAHGLNTTGTVGPNTATIAINNAITLGDLTPIGPNVDALTCTTGDITIADGNLELPNTDGTGSEGVIIFGGNRFIHNFGTTATDSVFVGAAAGNFTQTGGLNIGFGGSALRSIDSGSQNVAIGPNAMDVATSATANVIVGTGGAFALTSGQRNTGIGFGVFTEFSVPGNGLTTGIQNTVMGYEAGQDYRSNESNNILINSFGVLGDQNIMRIGEGTGTSDFQLQATFISGIFGVTPAGATQTVVIDANGQLGSTSSSVVILSYTNVNTTPYVVTATDTYLGVDCSGGAITIQLPNSTTTGRVITVKDRTGNANTNNITVTTVGGAVNIDGATTYVMNTQYAAVNVLFDGTTYQIW